MISKFTTFDNVRNTLFFIILITVLPACQEEEEETDARPDVFLYPDNSEMYRYEGDSVKVEVNVTSPEYIKHLKVYSRVNQQQEDVDTTVAFDKDKEEYTYPLRFKVPESESGDAYHFRFACEDQKGNTDEEKLTIRILGLRFSSTRTLHAPADSSTDSFLSLQSGTIYNLDEAGRNQKSVDMLYYYDSTAQSAGFYAPADSIAPVVFDTISRWLKRKQTYFIDINKTAQWFDTLESHHVSELKAAVPDTGSIGISGLSTGDVIGYVTQDGKKGIARVSGLQAGNEAADYIDFAFKVMERAP